MERQQLTDKELRKLSRAELLEMLIEEAKRAADSERRLAEANARLEKREINIAEAGNLAEAVLKLNGVYEAAQKACLQYTENIARISGEQDELKEAILDKARTEAQAMKETAEAECKELKMQTTAECRDLKTKTAAECEALRRDAEHHCEALRQSAEKESQAYWTEIYEKLERYRQAHAEVGVLLNMDVQRQALDRKAAGATEPQDDKNPEPTVPKSENGSGR